MQAIALTDFVHGDINAVEGHPVTHRNGSELRQALADDLERAGLIRLQRDPVIARPVLSVADQAKAEAGKAPDDGAGQPSSASHPAPASPTATLHSSRPGDGKPRKRGR